MSMIGDIKKLDSYLISWIVIFFAGIIGPGTLIIYLFKPDLFISLSVSKLVLFSLSLTIPQAFVVMLAVALIPMKMDKEIEEEAGKEVSSFVGLLVSFCILYLMILISYLSKSDFGQFLKHVIYVDIFVFLFFAFIAWAAKTTAHKLKITKKSK